MHPLASLTVTSKLKVPFVVGVPEIAPAVDNVKPVGKAPEVTAKLGVPNAPVCVNVLL